MKILHTSDWHLGHTLMGYDRTEEQQQMLDQMVKITREQQPDVFLLCGDVYHSAQPSATVQTMFTNALVSIHRACPTMTIITTAGNHDSGIKHDIFHTPWLELGVHTIGNLDRQNLMSHIIEITDKGFIIALPYANERNIPDGMFQQLLDEVGRRNTHSLPVVMTAHTTIRGCDFSGHDNATEYSVGGIDYLDINQLGEGYDYLALGHIHHQQFVHTGRHNVRYSGSPLPVSFDENYEHTVSIVDINAHWATPQITQILVNNPHPLVTLPTQGFASWDEAKAIFQNFPDDLAAYIRLNVRITDFLPHNAKYEAEQIAQRKQCRFCLINAKRIQHENAANNHVMTINEFRTQQPITIARQFAKDKGIEFDETMQQLFLQAVEKVRLSTTFTK